ncbi:arylsulfatase [Prolixibacteraceae bacterium Z1-6]|uniref:Arylsulfatase n=1 Tax=Draconibacterium aestuarii TaxID=2998507 RepID=A0A9X3J696_9BACT|nr:arylsulfatase [Prolixibacteraceae bacterium Z1-6]
MSILKHLSVVRICNRISIVVLSIFVIAGCQVDQKEEQNPNIIFIMADDLGYGHLGCYGQQLIQTPNIDKMATEGMIFTQAYAGCSLCAPARSTLMTGTHTGHTSVRGNGGGVSLQEADITVADIFKKAGYKTGLFGKWGLGETGTAGTPNKKGFDEFFGYLHQLHAQFYYPEFLWQNEEKYCIPENANNNCGVYSHDLIMEKAFDFVRNNQNEPFFLYLPIAIPHHEFVVPEESMKLYLGKFEEHPIPHWRDGYALPAEPRATMAAMITHMDKGIGQLMQLIRELNIDEKTLVIFTSDNGAAYGPLPDPEFFKANGPLKGLKGSFYEGGIRVPMIARWPGHIQPESKNDHVLYFPDVLPTLAELANAKTFLPEKIDGISYLPTLLGKGVQDNHDFLYWENADYERQPPYGVLKETLEQAVLMDQWKAVKNSPDSAVELYKLSEDIGEENDVAADFPQIVKRALLIMRNEHNEAPPQTDMTAEKAQDLYVPDVGCTTKR